MLYYSAMSGGRFQYILFLHTQVGMVTGSPFTVGIQFPGSYGALSFLSSDLLALSDFVLNADDPDPGEIQVPGLPPMTQSRWMDSMWMRYALRVQSLRHLAREGKRQRRENAVLHFNLVGRAVSGSSSSGNQYPVLSEDEAPFTPVMQYRPYDFYVHIANNKPTAITLPSYLGFSSYQQTIRVVGVHDDRILGEMNSGVLDQGQLLWFGYHSGLDTLSFFNIQIDQSWLGGYRCYYRGYYVTIATNVSSITTPGYYPDGFHHVTPALSVSMLAHSSTMFDGWLYEDFDYEPQLPEVRDMFINQGIIEPRYQPNVLDITNSSTVAIARLDDALPASPSLIDGVGYNITYGTFNYVPGVSHEFLTFCDVARSRIPTFIGGTYLSAVDSFDKFYESIESNFIETAAELKSILAPIQAFKNLSSIPALLRTGSRGVVAILKTIASADLAYRFGVVPTLQDAVALQRDLVPVLNRISSLSEWTESRGIAIVELDADAIPGFSPCLAVYHTKAIWRLEPDSFGTHILASDRLGVLPTFSRLWDLIPFSWLSDYFLNIGNVFHLVDSQLLMALVSVKWSTSSMTLYHPLDYLADDYNFIFEEGSVPTYKVYARFHLPGALPVLGPGSTPLLTSLAPDKLIKRWDILGSIAVQKAR
jgi:hypothetical protein